MKRAQHCNIKPTQASDFDQTATGSTVSSSHQGTILAEDEASALGLYKAHRAATRKISSSNKIPVTDKLRKEGIQSQGTSQVTRSRRQLNRKRRQSNLLLNFQKLSFCP